MIEQSKIHEIKGVGEKTEKLFAKLGIYTVGDLLRYYPRNYDVYEEAVPIAEVEDGRTVIQVKNMKKNCIHYNRFII